MKKIRINEKIEFVISRGDSNFDRACDSANMRFFFMLGADDYGHMKNVDGFDRSLDYIEITFISYVAIHSMVEVSHQYKFSGCVKRNEETEDE